MSAILSVSMFQKLKIRFDVAVDVFCDKVAMSISMSAILSKKITIAGICSARDVDFDVGNFVQKNHDCRNLQRYVEAGVSRVDWETFRFN